MNLQRTKDNLISILQILRWNKPSGRLILLIPAGWSLWLANNGQQNFSLIIKIALGGLLVSGFGCVANDLWDSEIDKEVSRTKERPLAANKLNKIMAFFILILLMIASLVLTISIKGEGGILSLSLAFLALPFILIYPSTKRWFKFPQFFLSICWGFAVLIPWAAVKGDLKSFVLLFCWLATIFWTFGFDTVYALADKKYDIKIGVNSSAIHLGSHTKIAVQLCYLFTSIFLGFSALLSDFDYLFWPIWFITSILMQRDTIKIFKRKEQCISLVSTHFRNQVIYGSLFLIGFIISK